MTEAAGIPIVLQPGQTNAQGQVVMAPVDKWKAREMWAAKFVAALLTALYATGAIPTTGPVMQVAAIAATTLAYLGFAVSKGKAP